MIWIILEELGKSAAAVGGLILSVPAYFAGRARGVREREEDRAVRRMQEAEAARRAADRRIDEVLQRYADLVRHNKTGALHGLLVAGIKNLRSAEEVEAARRRAEAQVGKDPLRQYALQVDVMKAFIGACEFDAIRVKNEALLLERFGLSR